ncbi:MAG: CPBP family intramembrane metalloprotease [Myxococcus sp.]|nr:CPBP family intramembrane metalloprotease [Myxococcus sp.]
MADRRAPPPRSRWRVWGALIAAPFILGGAVLPLAGYLARSRGLRGDALVAAVEPLAPLPVTAGFVGVFLLTRWLARRDGLGLEALGWRRPTARDVALGLGAGAALSAVNTFLLHPLVQAAQPTFDPTLRSVALPAMVVSLGVAAVAEDTLYRGYAFTVLAERSGVAAAVVVTSLFYALLTPGSGWALVSWAASFGVALGGLRWWRGGLWPVTVAHWVVALSPRLLAELAPAPL